MCGPPCSPGNTDLSICGGQGLFAQDHAAARTAKGFVRSGGHDVEAEIQRVGQSAARHHARVVGRVAHGQGAHFVGYRLERCVIQITRIGGVPGQQQLGTMLQRSLADGFEVERTVCRVGLVADEIEELAHMRYGRSVGQVSAVGKIHGQDRIAGLQQPQIHGLVHGRTGQRLHIGMLRTKHLTGPLARQVLQNVRIILSAVIAAAGVAFGILVGEHGPQCGEHLRIGVILRRNQLDAGGLTLFFSLDEFVYAGIGLGKKIKISLHGQPPVSPNFGGCGSTPVTRCGPGERLMLSPASPWLIPRRVASCRGDVE